MGFGLFGGGMPAIPHLLPHNAKTLTTPIQQQVPTNAQGLKTDYVNAMGDQGLTQGARDRIERRHQEEFLINQWERTSRYNGREAEINRDFQKEMSNTAITRRMEDLRRNGLNPNLAFIGTGMNGMSASTPSGASASMGLGQAPSQAKTSKLELGFVGKILSAIAMAL